MNKIAMYEALLEDHPLWANDFVKEAIIPAGGSRLERAVAASAFLGGLGLLGAAAGAVAGEEGDRGRAALRGAAAGVVVPTALSYGSVLASRAHPKLRPLEQGGLLGMLAAPAVAPVAGYLAAKRAARKED